MTEEKFETPRDNPMSLCTLQREQPTQMHTRNTLTITKAKRLTSSGALILTLGVAIAGSLVYSPTATATPNNALADLKVVSIGDANDNWCPVDNGSSLTYRVKVKNVRDDGAYLGRVSFTAGSNQALAVSYAGADDGSGPTATCTVYTTPNLAVKVAYCDIAPWDVGDTLNFDFTVTTSANDLNVAAQVYSLTPDPVGGFWEPNYLEHAYNSGC